MNIFFIVALIVLISFFSGWLVGKRTKNWAAPAFAINAISKTRLLTAHKALAERTQKRLDRIMEKAEKAGRISNDGVEDLFCISDRTASNYLRTLTESGRLQKKGVGRGTYYVPVKKAK